VENIETNISMKGVKGKRRMENIEKIENDFKKMSILVVIFGFGVKSRKGKCRMGKCRKGKNR
jgi:tryptophan synthase alpha subunit